MKCFLKGLYVECKKGPHMQFSDKVVALGCLTFIKLLNYGGLDHLNTVSIHTDVKSKRILSFP